MPRNVQGSTDVLPPSALSNRYAWLGLAGFALVEFLALQSEQAFSYSAGGEIDVLGLARLTVILPAGGVLIAALLIAPVRLRLAVLGLGMATALFHRALLRPETLFIDSQNLFDRSLVELLLIGLIIPPLVRRVAGPTPQFSQVRTIIGSALVTALGLAFCEEIVVLAVHTQNPEVPILSAWRLGWRGYLLGAVAIVPTAVLWNEWRRVSFEGMNRLRWLEFGALLGLLVVGRAWFHGTGATAFVDLPLTLWALYRFPQAVPAMTVLLLVLAESYLIARAPGLAELPRPRYAQLIGIQGAMLAPVIATHLIAAGIAQWRAAFGLLSESQERLRMTLEAARDGTFEWGLLTDAISFQPSLGEVYGYGPDASPRTMTEVLPFMHPEDVPRWADYRMRMDDPGGTQEQEVRIKAASGEWIWFRVRGAAVEFNDEGKGERAVGVFEDVTERKTAEQALRESEQRSRTMAALSSEGISKLVYSEPIPLDLPDDEMIVRLFEDLRVENCNEVNARMYGFESAAAMAGAWVKDFAPAVPMNTEHLRRFVRSGFGMTEGEVRNIDRQGNEKYCIVNVTGIVEGNALHGVWRFARDITERKQAELDLAKSNKKLRQIIASAQESSGIIGDSLPMETVREGIEMIASTGFTALILGETGTGKELVARAIHSRSQRKGRPLVTVNCATLTPTLIESELFGHEKGAFTGAVAAKLGRFELADGGTILLDEIGELPLELQVKLLRVLQEGEFERVGGTCTHRVDVRILAATNRDLKAAVDGGNFRADLFYRLHVFPIHLPPLRERGDDVIALANHFLDLTSKNLGRPLSGFTSRSLQLLSAYRWPGNVRELRHVVERAAILSPGPVVEIDDFFLHSVPDGVSPLRTLEDVERGYIQRVLELTGWAVEGADGAAAILGLAPSTLRNRLLKLGLKRQKSLGASAGSDPAV